MAAIHCKNTTPEMQVRRYLWRNGFRYTLNHPRLPGKPDLVLRKYRTCVFVNGCFWHGHNTTSVTSQETGGTRLENSACCRIPKTNTDFWTKKILRNKERDRKTQHQLSQMGWNSITIWECQLKPKQREQTLASLAYTLNHIFLQRKAFFRYSLQEDSFQEAAEENHSYHNH